MHLHKATRSLHRLAAGVQQTAVGDDRDADAEARTALLRVERIDAEAQRIVVDERTKLFERLLSLERRRQHFARGRHVARREEIFSPHVDGARVEAARELVELTLRRGLRRVVFFAPNAPPVVVCTTRTRAIGNAQMPATAACT